MLGRVGLRGIIGRALITFTPTLSTSQGRRPGMVTLGFPAASTEVTLALSTAAAAAVALYAATRAAVAALAALALAEGILVVVGGLVGWGGVVRGLSII